MQLEITIVKMINNLATSFSEPFDIVGKTLMDL